KSSPERVAELAQSDVGWDPELWPQVAELGWIGLSVPEDKGGAGFGFLEEAVLFEEMGYALYPGPYFATVGLALPALVDDDNLPRVLGGDAPATFAYAEPSGPSSFYDLENVGTKAEKTNGSWRLSGEKHLVPDAQVGGYAVVVARTPDGVALFLVDVTDGIVSPAVTVDTTRRLARLSLDGVEAQLLVDETNSSEVLEKIRLRGLASLSLEAVGIAQRALELAIGHSTERKQFDKPIGAYQAVSHQVSNIYMETELARSLAYWAAWCVAEGDEQASVAVAAAKSAAAEAAVAACERSIQVHGGIGFTWEHVLHRFYKRAQWIDSFEGFGSTQRKTIAARLLD
ncbi:MAG: acyl-CoA/acyl-ACP dehydrogenase, partial [Actinobacteria bacterium]|nr:acyl-CoA/acyl-ACP dehydrogenase [Actinomycetota bacterium]